jgi:hypothetical protein
MKTSIATVCPRIVRSQVAETADGTLGQSHIDRGEESRLAD